jgi:hypothetical protein
MIHKVKLLVIKLLGKSDVLRRLATTDDLATGAMPHIRHREII